MLLFFKNFKINLLILHSKLKYLIYVLIRFIYIFTFIIGLTFTSFAQTKQTEQQQKILKLYPIPASTTITFDFVRSYDRLSSLQIYNFMGKKVYEVRNVSARMVLPLNDFFFR